MRKIKKSSLVYLMLPILFSGCIQEKTSTIIPSKSTDNKVIQIDKDKSVKTDTKELNSSKKSHTTTFNYTPPTVQKTYSLSKLTITEPSKTKSSSNKPTILDELALSVQNSMEVKVISDSQLVTQALEVDDNWHVLTKEDEIIETAKEFLGVKYVWAANGPNAFDCSGFTKYVFKKHGVSLPRYSGYQANVGIKVNYDELERGDLVFFDTEKHSKSKRKVNHVGIYLGNHKFIHASSGGKKVMITSFNQKKFYKKKFMHGQRILNSPNRLALLDK